MIDLDLAILYWIRHHMVYSWLTPVMRTASALGRDGTIWLLICLLLLIPRSTRKISIVSVFCLAIATVFNNDVMKPIIARPRPFTYTDITMLIHKTAGWSFPSGHTATSFTVATSLFIGNHKYGIAAYSLAALIAFAQMYLFVHFPSDVIAGMAEGIIIAVIVCKLADYAMKKSSVNSGKL